MGQFFWGFGPTSRQAVVVIKSQAHAMQNICKYSKAHAMQNICKYSKAYIHQVNSPAHLNVGDVRHSVGTVDCQVRGALTRSKRLALDSPQNRIRD